MLFKWTPNFVPRKIFIFGCGGTGSRVVPLVAQFVKSCPWVLDPEIHLFDFDEVETKNLLRQNFIASDVGKNKAVVLANRYSKAFNIAITPHINKLLPSPKTEAEVSLKNSVYDKVNIDSNNLFILCVDTPEARRQIIKCLVQMTGGTPNFLIDAGNENDFGQVTLSSLLGATETEIARELRNDSPVECDLHCIPFSPKYFETMVATSTPSCADLDQTMAINTLMAVNIFAVIQNIYYVKPISFHRINISMQHGAVPQYISAAYLSQLGSSSECRGEIGDYTHRTSFYSELDKAYYKQKEFDQMIKAEAEKATAAKKETAAVKGEGIHAAVVAGVTREVKASKKKSAVEALATQVIGVVEASVSQERPRWGVESMTITGETLSTMRNQLREVLLETGGYTTSAGLEVGVADARDEVRS